MASSRETYASSGTLTQAMAVFLEGFGVTRSFTHPYPVDRVSGVWVLRDAPRKKAEDYRREEWVTCDLAPAEVDQAARKHTRGRFSICALTGVDANSDQALRTAYKALGYRLTASEPVMMHSLTRIPRVSSPGRIERVCTQETADALAKAARSRQILPEHLVDDAPLRAYVAVIGGEIVGWVRSVACDSGNWCSNMFVLPAHRRQGIGRALLTRMLQDDRLRRAKCAILTASKAGAKLYVTVGYRQIGTLLLFVPRK